MGQPVCLGIVVGVHGVRGILRVKSFTEDPRDIAAYGPLTDGAGRRHELEVVGEAKGILLVRVAGVADRTAAEALKGVELLIDRDRLPAPEPGAFYYTDLVGLAAERVDGTPFGEVVAMHDFGAGDIVEIRIAGERKTVMLPFTETVVPVVDIAGGRLVVEPPEGLVENEPATDEAE